jgi:RNA polymerase sigma factor (sigma-70 family)
LKAIVSGQAGWAAIREDVAATGYSIDDPISPVVFADADLHLLFDGATDVVVVDVADHRAAVSLLESEWSRDRLLQMLLVLLRAGADEELRTMAAESAEELFAKTSARRFVLNRLYSHPLTEDADVASAIRIARNQHLGVTASRLEDLSDDQKSIAAVAATWRGVGTVMPDRARTLRRLLETHDVFYRLGHAKTTREIDVFEIEWSLEQGWPTLTMEVVRHLGNGCRSALPPDTPRKTEVSYKLDPAEMLVANLAVIDGVIRMVGRRYRLSPEDIDEIGGDVKLKLVANDYAVIRQFEGRSSFRTYIATVVRRAVFDSFSQKHGRRHPSREAQALGEEAVRLEQLLLRGYSYEEARRTLTTSHLPVSENVLDAIYPRLRPRWPRPRFVPLSPEIPDRKPIPFDDAVATEFAGALSESVGRLSREDRHLVQLRYWRDLPVREIARELNLNEKSVYKRLHRVRRTLRREIEQTGFHSRAVEIALSRRSADASGSEIDAGLDRVARVIWEEDRL